MESKFLEVLKNRRSIRRFKEDKIDKETVEQILKAGLLAPSSKNKKPVEFIVVQDDETLQKLKNSKSKGVEGLNSAPLAIVVIGDSDLSDVWVEDGSIATILLQLEALELGLGSCWIQIRNRMSDQGKSEDEVRRILAIPEKYSVLSILAIGYKNEDFKPYDDSIYDFSKVHFEKFE